MQEAYSRLKTLLNDQGLNTADLVRKIADQGDRINPKSIYRLADPEEPLEKADMRVISAICQALGVHIGDILTFEEPGVIEEFSQDKQKRMDSLLARLDAKEHIDQSEMIELRALVNEAEEVAKGNARRLANRKRRLMKTTPSP